MLRWGWQVTAARRWWNYQTHTCLRDVSSGSVEQCTGQFCGCKDRWTDRRGQRQVGHTVREVTVVTALVSHAAVHILNWDVITGELRTNNWCSLSRHSVLLLRL